MAEDLLKEAQDLLKEESWTRAAISNITQNDIQKLEKYVDRAVQEGKVLEVRELCDEHLARSKDSITALYISGMLALLQKTLDNSALVSLVDILNKNKKEAIVEYICAYILEKDENNKFALRALADRYREDKNEKMWDLYEKIVKIDFEEADMAKALAEHYEEAGDADNAMSFYKKALHRYVGIKNISAVKEVWSKLVALIPQEIDFFLSVQRKVAKSISEDKSALLMQELSVPNFASHRYYARGLDPDREYHFTNRVLKHNIKAFGDLVNAVAPVHVKNDSFLQDVISRFVKMDGETEDYFVYGDLLMHSGVALKQAFAYTGYSSEVRLFQDFASRIYFMEGE